MKGFHMKSKDKNIIKRKTKRTWVYVQKPSEYGISPCKCGNTQTQWSEYKKHLWCAKCKIDFIPKNNGVFDGPIPIGVAGGLGLDFRRWDLKKKKLLKEL